jgi:hypothetical protein
MINLYEKGTNKLLGSITDDQLQFLQDNLEEEWSEDQDYAITPMLVDFFDGQGADPNLVTLLKDALAGREEIEITWSGKSAGA